MKRFILLASIFISATLSMFAQEIWDNIKFPANLNGAVTAMAVKGDEIYLGTAGDGIWYSSNYGTDWNRTYNDIMLKDSITHILFSPSGSVFATGRSLIYKTTDVGREWLLFYEIIRQQELITCIAVSPTGMLAVGTNRSVFVADKETDGTQWYKISTQLELANCKSIIIDNYETVFVSFTRDMKTYFIYRYHDSKEGWVETIKGILEDPKVEDFTMDQNFDLYAAIANKIYKFNYELYSWDPFVADKDDEILKVRFSLKGNFMTLGRRFVKIYNAGDTTGTVITDLDATKLKEIIITARDRFVGVGFGSIIVSNVDIGGIITWVRSTKFTLYDANGALLPNRTFSVFKATCDAGSTYLKDVTTNSVGVFSLSLTYFGLTAGDRLRIEKAVYRKASVKSGHEALDNEMYEIRLNNQKYDGLGAPSYYAITTADNQSITLEHSVVYHNVLISVEWDAKREFLDSLASWARLMSDFYYDVSDGQLIIYKVAIYDNKQKWDQADIRFFASNQVWPNAHVGGINLFDDQQAQVRMPRRWWGNGGDTRNWTSATNWFRVNEDDNFMGTASTMAHELGHYMLGYYDEYVFVDTNKAKLLPAGYNYGYMCYQYQNGNMWSSELSSAVRYPNDNYKITAQWYYNHKDCWSQFKDKFQNTYSADGASFWCPIKKPSERTLNSGYQYLLGPADHMTRQATCSVKNVTEIQIFDQNFGSGDFRFTAIDQNSNVLGNVSVMLSRSYGPITITKPYQGCTPDNGQMLVLGAEVGDVVSAMYLTKVYYPLIGYIDWPAFAFFPVNSITTFDKQKNDKQLEEPRIIIKPLTGTFELLNTIKYDAEGNLNLEGFSKKPFPDGTSADVQVSNDTLENFKLFYSSNDNLYNLPITKFVPGEGLIKFNAQDSAGTDFSFPIFYNFMPANTNNFAPKGDAELIIDNTSQSIKNVAFVSCIFPASRNGLASNQEHVGSYFSFAVYPAGLDSKSSNILNIRYNVGELVKQSEENLRIFMWDAGRQIWTKIGGMVDTARNTVSSPISLAGTYTLFTEDNATGLNDNGSNDFGLKISPNPATKNCTITFNTLDMNQVSLKLYNSLGMEVSNIFTGMAVQGINHVPFDTSTLEPGIYFVRLSVNNSVITAKMVVVR